MGAPGWLTRSQADVPAGEAWLGEREHAVLAGLTVPKRRADWLLGRYTAKCAAAAWLGAGAADVEIVAAPDGAPEAWAGDRRAPVAISLSHRDGRALAVAGDAGEALGCDLERVEPRSGAFVREWLAAPERALVEAAAAERRALAANLVWTAKEAAAKSRREGLRLDVRQAVARLRLEDAGEWRALTVEWPGRGPTQGWWREEPGWVMAVTAEPAPEQPRRL